MVSWQTNNKRKSINYENHISHRYNFHEQLSQNILTYIKMEIAINTLKRSKRPLMTISSNHTPQLTFGNQIKYYYYYYYCCWEGNLTSVLDKNRRVNLNLYRELHESARAAREDLGHVEGLRHESLRLARAGHRQLVVLAQLVHSCPTTTPPH